MVHGIISDVLMIYKFDIYLQLMVSTNRYGNMKEGKKLFFDLLESSTICTVSTITNDAMCNHSSQHVLFARNY
jgi:hypothetical protein